MPDGRARWALAILALLALMAAGGGWLASIHRPAPVVISTVTPPSPPAQTPAQKTPLSTHRVPSAIPSTPPPPVVSPTLLYVDVAGAVRHPGLYQLPPGSRVWHAVKAAGGATSKADLDALNLAEKVQDGEKVYVPLHTVQASQMAASTANNSLSSNQVAVSPVRSEAVKSDRATSSTPTKLFSPSQGMVDINTADADSLERLPGIGAAMADRILAYRQEAGKFTDISQLQQVSGIGPRKYARIAPMVKL